MTPTAIPDVPFVCVHDAGRSQMAAALLEHHAGGRVQVRSAGSAPAASINPAVREVMAEIGLNLYGAHPTLLTDGAVRAADVVITLGCGDSCPVHPGKRYLDWDLPDPAGRTAEEIRPIRDEITSRVRALLADLDLDPGWTGPGRARHRQPPVRRAASIRVPGRVNTGHGHLTRSRQAAPGHAGRGPAGRGTGLGRA